MTTRTRECTAATWRPEQDGNGSTRLVRRCRADCVEASELLAMAGLWHPLVLAIEDASRSGEMLIVRTEQTVLDAVCETAELRAAAAATINAATARRVEPDELVVARDRLGLARVAPPLGCPTRGVLGSPPEGLFGLQFNARHEPIELAEQLLAALALEPASWIPRAVIFHGPPGCGKSSLLRQLAVRASLRSLAVERSVPREIGERPTVLVLDDLDRVAGDELARAAVLAEQRPGKLLVFSSAASAYTPVEPPGLALDRVRLEPLGETQLAEAVIAPPGPVRRLSRAARGNPLRLRLLSTLMCGLSDRSLGTDISDAELAAGLVKTLSVEAQDAVLAIVEAGDDGLDATALKGLGKVALRGLFPLCQLERGRVRIANGELMSAAHDAFGRRRQRVARAIAPRLQYEPAIQARYLARAGAGDGARAALLSAPTGAPAVLALRHFDRAVAAGLEPDAVLLRRRADLLERCGRRAEALLLLAGLLDRGDGEETGSMRLRRAEILARSDAIAQARDELSACRAAGAGTAAIDLQAEFMSAWLFARTGDDVEARRRYEQALALAADEPEAIRADGLAGLGALLVRGPGGSRRGERLLAEAVTIFRRRGERARLSRALSRQGSVAARLGRPLLALERHLEALAQCLVDGDRVGAAECHCDVASAAMELGELSRAESHLRQARVYFEAADEPSGLTLARANLAAIAVELGRPDEACPVLEASLRAARASGLVRTASHDLRWLGHAALVRGATATARERFEEALTASRDVEDARGEAASLLGQAGVALDERDFENGGRLAEAGLRALAPRPRGVVALRLRLVLVEARARHGAVHEAESLWRRWRTEAFRHSDPSVVAEARRIAAILEATMGHLTRAASAFSKAIVAAEQQERPDVLGRAIAASLEHVGDRFESSVTRALVDKLHRLYDSDELRLRLAGFRLPQVMAAAPAPEALATDSLIGLDLALRLATESDSAADPVESALAFVRERVPFLRAAFLEPDELGLRVIRCLRAQSAMTADDESDRPSGMQLALLLSERCRALGDHIAAERLELDEATRSHPEVVSWALGSAFVARSRNGLLLYIDRARRLPVFSIDERRFVIAAVERVSLELERDEPGAVGLRGHGAPSDYSTDDTSARDGGIVGVSAAVVALRRELRQLAPFDLPVFLAGESGTGKELAAATLHRRSPRANRPLVAVNCAAFADSLLETELFGAVQGAYTGAVRDRPGLLAEADGGTLFLDEVAELSLAFQAKLLRVVEMSEYRPVGSSRLCRFDIRLVCATNRDIRREVAEGRFREDLYYRLMAAATVELPPLRERRGDVPVLLAHFCARSATASGLRPLTFSRSALSALEEYSFPGNVRELERLIAGLNARSLARRVELKELPATVRGVAGRADESTSSLREARRMFERRYLEQLLMRHGNNRTRAARTAGVARQTLVTMIKRHGLESTPSKR